MTAKPDLISTAKLPDTCWARLEERFQIHMLPGAGPERDAFLARVGTGVRFLQTSGGGSVPATLIAALPKLEIISSYGVGYDGVDVAAASARGIVVTNTPGVLNDCVADTAMGLMLGAMRRLPQADQHVRTGAWPKGGQALTVAVHHKKLGILGFGRIGKTIAKRAAGFDMEIAYHSRTKQADAAVRYFDTAVDLAAWCDVLVVITPGGAATRHLVNADVLKALGPHGYLVNVARGSVVDEAALLAALQNGTIAGAGLDVFEDEPRVPAAFFALDNVALAPHVGSATVETRKAMGDLAVDNLIAHLEGRPKLTPVN
jgi:lactate dehydrogenase-like 2-hydroxyacid dehydrogenase